MEFEGTVTVDAPRGEVFDRMQEPGMLERTIPNCKDLEQTGDQTYVATVEESIARVSMEMDVNIEITELTPHDHVEVTIDGEAPTGNSTVDAVGSFDLTDASEQTQVDYHMDIEVSGKLASLGFRVLKRFVSQRIDTMVDNIQTEFEDAQAET